MIKLMDNLPQNSSDVSSPVPSDLVGKKIIIFGRSSCPDCARIKKFLAENAIEYDFKNIDQDKLALKWVSSFSTFIPVLVMLDGTIMYAPSNTDLMNKIQGDSINKKVTMVEPELFDVVIIGAGPAGSSAAIYAVRKSLKVLVVTKTIGGQAAQSGDVENYLGFTMISGADLAMKFREDLKRFENDGIWLKEGVDVSAIEGFENNYVVKTAQGGAYRGRTVLIATGRVPRLLGVPGEKEFFGKGIATCATCDAPLFRGRRVAVVGGGNSALDAAISLMKIAKEVTIINNQPQLKGDSIMMANVSQAKNVKVLNAHDTTAIKGTKTVEGIVVKNQ